MTRTQQFGGAMTLHALAEIAKHARESGAVEVVVLGRPDYYRLERMTNASDVRVWDREIAELWDRIPRRSKAARTCLRTLSRDSFGTYFVLDLAKVDAVLPPVPMAR